MKSKILVTFLILFFFVPLILVIPRAKADELFFVDFYVEDSQGTPLNGVEIEVTGIYDYHEIVNTGGDGYAPRLELFPDHRNAHYSWTATYQLNSKSGDFYVPDNYNAVNIVMLDVNAPTPTPSPTPTLTPSPTPTPTPTSTPTSTPTPHSPTPTPTTSPTTPPTTTPNSTPTTTPTSTPPPEPTHSPDLEFNFPLGYLAAGIIAVGIIVVLIFLLRRK